MNQYILTMWSSEAGEAKAYFDAEHDDEAGEMARLLIADFEQEAEVAVCRKYLHRLMEVAV